MAEISASMVKALRDASGQGMMECKKALTEAGGDMDAAMDILRKKGLAKAEKKADREAKEGLVAIADDAAGAAMVEVLCETDFCARNDEFKAMVQQVAHLAAGCPDGPVEATEQITHAVQACFNKIGENMRFGRGVKISAPTVGRYVHHNSKVGVLVGVEGEIDAEVLDGLCMHVAFTDPMAISSDQIPAEEMERERRLASEQAAETGKPPQVVEKIVEGKVRKFLSDNSLLDQPFVRDESKKVSEVLGAAKVTAFARFAIGQ